MCPLTVLTSSHRCCLLWCLLMMTVWRVESEGVCLVSLRPKKVPWGRLKYSTEDVALLTSLTYWPVTVTQRQQPQQQVCLERCWQPFEFREFGVRTLRILIQNVVLQSVNSCCRAWTWTFRALVQFDTFSLINRPSLACFYSSNAQTTNTVTVQFNLN